MTPAQYADDMTGDPEDQPIKAVAVDYSSCPACGYTIEPGGLMGWVAELTARSVSSVSGSPGNRLAPFRYVPRRRSPRLPVVAAQNIVEVFDMTDAVAGRRLHVLAAGRPDLDCTNEMGTPPCAG